MNSLRKFFSDRNGEMIDYSQNNIKLESSDGTEFLPKCFRMFRHRASMQEEMCKEGKEGGGGGGPVGMWKDPPQL